MGRDVRKMKIGRYISISITALFFFILSWILTNLGETSRWGLYVWGIAGIIMVIYFTSISLNMLGYSITGAIKGFKTINEEKGLWKILTIIFRIAMLVFASLITIFWLVWLINMITDGFTGSSAEGVNWFENLGFYSKAYISGIDGRNVTEFNLYVTSFVFILIWAASGITFEILKKVLGGYRKENNDNNTNEINNQNDKPTF